MDTRFKHHRSVIGIVGKILEMKLVAGCGAKGMTNPPEADKCRMKEFYLF
jgi:ribosomal protein L40E